MLEDRDNYEDKRSREELRPVIGAILVALLTIVVAVVASYAYAAPKAQSPQECGVAADMAIVARSLAAEGIDRRKADTIMSHIYDVTDSERAQQLMNAILATAYRMTDTSPPNFATELLGHCMRSGGNMDAMIGGAGT
jgi:hypothetical protein